VTCTHRSASICRACHSNRSSRPPAAFWSTSAYRFPSGSQLRPLYNSPDLTCPRPTGLSADGLDPHIPSAFYVSDTDSVGVGCHTCLLHPHSFLFAIK